ncbi:MAG: insulinase family protein [Syntrophales bacterium]|jgi:hypothetical protein|nr:insulinase family protein [Syntrophales bacterium]HOG06618.1 insulinase family protein [Syntrophales bacterium]HPB69388.1 insulinase family protein [Syntrophales bacterium]HQN25923.1 insulinase family protein [Syntrophales bacterium]HQP29413.1 insulinase family protein [Syntrophales bacterium]
MSPVCPESPLRAGDVRHGFLVQRIEAIPDLCVTACELVHEATGAQVVHLQAHDRENLFAIGFRTPPPDSTGLPHILEHSVLAGSERYPVKDAFNELLRGTLQTFLNAFTYPDKTVYPVASQTRQDFYNLARVYIDLTLRPRLRRETFLQEGHHLEFTVPDDIASDLTVSGVVYNEMKGAYSSPDALMAKVIQESLFPQTPYACDSGGDPDVIPTLTYEAFRAFHRMYYSPSNARIFLYGDIPTEDHLIFLAEMLSGFARVSVDSAIPGQPRWKKSVAVRGTYPIGRDESASGKSVVNVAWMLAENLDGETVTLLEVAADALVGSAAGPLRKALIDSGLGEDLSSATGMERDLRQVAFAVGLRGTDADRADRIEALILDTLERVAREGFARDLIEGALHQVEFHGREIVRGAYPYGIVLMGRAYHTWLYDGDPFAGLNFPRIIGRIREQWSGRSTLFQDIVRQWLIENPHRVLSVMVPDPDDLPRREAAFRERMARLKASLPVARLEEIRTQTEALRKYQTEADSSEALATLPKLQLKDIPRDVETVPTQRTAIAGVPTLRHELFTNGIAYLDLAFDLSHLPEALHPWLPLLGKCTTHMGAAGHDYADMARRITLKTGGLGCGLQAGLLADDRGHWQKMTFHVRALHRNIEEAVSILIDLLSAGDLEDAARLKDLIAERKNGLQASVIPSGHIFARRAAGAALSLPAYRDEQWHGRTQLKFMHAKAQQGNADPTALQEPLRTLKSTIFKRAGLILNLTADAAGLDGLTAALAPRLGALPAGEDTAPAAPVLPLPHHPGIAIAAQVCYVAKLLPAPAYDNPLTAALMVAARHLAGGYLYKHVRLQGGAYGGLSAYDPLAGVFAFLSYRDPHIVQTLTAYTGAVKTLIDAPVPVEELTKAIIGTIGALDKPLDPSGRGHVAMIREFVGLTDERRQRLRSAILEMTPQGIREAMARYFREAEPRADVAVLAPEDRLRQANQALGNTLVLETLG